MNMYKFRYHIVNDTIIMWINDQPPIASIEIDVNLFIAGGNTHNFDPQYKFIEECVIDIGDIPILKLDGIKWYLWGDGLAMALFVTDFDSIRFFS
jgi:hypothetical protein